MSTHTKPIKLQLLEGNPGRRTKAEIERRLSNEVHLGNHDFKPTAQLKADAVALREWTRVVTMFLDAGIDFVTTADAAMLERRAMAFARVERLQTRERHHRNQMAVAEKRIAELDLLRMDMSELVSDLDNPIEIEYRDKVHQYNAAVKDEAAAMRRITQISELLLRMEKELLLTPSSRVSRVFANTERQKKENSNDTEMFGT